MNDDWLDQQYTPGSVSLFQDGEGNIGITMNKQEQLSTKKYPMFESLDEASPERKGCVKCALFTNCEHPFTEPVVPEGWTGEILAVGEAPGEHADAGKLLRQLKNEAGWKIKDFAYVNALRCGLPKDADASIAQIRACRPFLLHAIQTLSPKLVVAFGVVAIKALLNVAKASVTDCRGKTLDVVDIDGAKMVATFHPSAVLHGNEEARAHILHDLKAISTPAMKSPENVFPSPSKYIGFDTEYTPDGTLITAGTGNQDRAVAIDFNNEDIDERLTESLFHSEVLQGHSVMGDLDYLVKTCKSRVPVEWLNGTKIEDSLLMAKMINENREKGALGLESLACVDLHVKPWKEETAKLLKETGDASDWTQEQREERCRLDAWASHKLCELYRPKLSPNLVRFTTQITATLHRIGLAGACVDMETFHSLGKKWTAESAKLNDDITRVALRGGMEQFVVTVPSHKRELIYKVLGLKCVAFTEKAHLQSTDKYALAALLNGHPDDDWERGVLLNLAAHSKVSKLASTWYGGKSGRKSLEELIEPFPVSGLTGRLTEDAKMLSKGLLHNWLQPLGTATARRASGGEEDLDIGQEENRNSMNWPLEARRMIVSRWKGGKIASLDYRKLEPCIFAWYAGDEKMFSYFFDGGGYVDIAADLFGSTIEEGSTEYKFTKILHLSLQYNKQLKGLARDLWNKSGVKLADSFEVHLLEVEKIRNKYFKMFPNMTRYIDQQKRRVLVFQRVVSATGRVRHLPHVVKSEWDGRRDPNYWHKENQGINQPTQSLASDVTGSAMVDYEDRMLSTRHITYNDWHSSLLLHPWDPPASPLINEVHDELILDLNPSTGEEDLKLLVKMATTVPTLRKVCPEFDMPLKVKVTIGDCWGHE